MAFDFSSKNRIVIKIGSSLLVDNAGLREKWLKHFIADIAQLVEKNKIEVILVTSGAIALGKVTLNKSLAKTANSKLALQQKQAAAAIGQIHLMSHYQEIFAKQNLQVAQILLTASDCNHKERFINAQNTISCLLQNQVIPIINENDTVAVDEIKIGDNDRLAARVAQMVSANLLILLSDIDGLYTANPNTDKSAQLIKEVEKINKEIEDMAGDAVSGVGTGGMITKIKAAKMAAIVGCQTIITSGKLDGAISKLFSNQQNYTLFHADNMATKPSKKWLAGSINAKGEIIVNNCAKEALITKKTSLLPIGAVKIIGDFAAKEVVFIKDETGFHIATGVASYSSIDAKKIIGKNSSEVQQLFGKDAKKDLVHLDRMIILN